MYIYIYIFIYMYIHTYAYISYTPVCGEYISYHPKRGKAEDADDGKGIPRVFWGITVLYNLKLVDFKID